VGGLFALVAFAFARYVRLDGPGLVGLAFGAGLGLANILLGYLATRSALRKGTAAALRTMVGGFFVRLLALVALLWWCHTQAWVDEVAFALSFLAFFCAFLLLEVRMVQKSLDGSRRVA